MYIGLRGAPAFVFPAPDGTEEWATRAVANLSAVKLPTVRGCAAVAMRFGSDTQDRPIDGMAAQVLALLEELGACRRADVTDVGARWDRLVDPNSVSVQVKAARIPEDRPGGPGKVASAARGIAA